MRHRPSRRDLPRHRAVPPSVPALRERPDPPPGEGIVRLASHLVPWAERRAWRDEWEAELGHAWDQRSDAEQTPPARLALAVRALGALPDALELRRHHRGDSMLASDFRFACRRLLRRPGFAALVTLTLALGIGAATTVFTVVDAVLLRPLPFAQPDRLVELGVKMEGGYTVSSVRADVLDEWESQPAVVQRVTRFGNRSVVLEDGDPQSLRAATVSPDFFPLLGVRPRLGRLFAPEESASGARVAVVSNDLWRSALGADPDVVGRVITLSGERYTVVGVMPADFRYPRGRVSLWLPLPEATATTPAVATTATPPGPPPVPRLQAVARLAPGITLEQAQSMADQVGARMARARPDVKGWGLALEPVGAWRANPDMRRSLLILAGAVGCVLLIACGNAANLMLVRATTDRRNLVVRLALGATRTRVVRELMVEAALLAAAGGALGILLAHGGVRVMRAIMPTELVSLSYSPLALDGRVLAFAVTMAIGSVLLAGLGPALQATGRRAGLGGGDRAGTGTVEQKRLRSALVVGELALSVMLMVGAGLLLHSFARLSSVSPGMETGRLALVELSPSEARYADRGARSAFYEAVLERVRALPGVRAASVVSGVAGGSSFSFGLMLEAEGAGAPLASQPELLPFGEADTSYFRTLGIPILSGRAFTAADMAPESDVVIVDVNLARTLWPDGGAVGRRFRLDADGKWLTVVGVAGAVKLMGPDDRESPFTYYRPTPQGAGGQRTIAVRTLGDPASLLPALKAAVHAVDPLQPVLRVTTAEERYREPLMKPRFLLAAMSAFALVAALLAAVGLYGVIAFAVAQRTRELGVRMALGARAGQIVAAILGEGALLAVGGVVLGLIAAVAMSRVLGSLLFGVSPTDPLTLAAVAVGLAAVTLLACWIPARRASRVDPVVALRTE